MKLIDIMEINVSDDIFPADKEMAHLTKDRYNIHRKNLKTVGSIDKVQIMSEGTRYFLVFNGNPIGLVVLKESGNNTMIPCSNWIDPAFRGKGYIKKLYMWFMKKDIILQGDFDQTHNSKNLWKSFIGKTNMFLVNRTDNTKIQIQTEEQFELGYAIDSHYNIIMMK